MAKKTQKRKSALGGKPAHSDLSICQNCGKTFDDFNLAEITHGIWERVSPGEIMPSGECPKCGALCHPIEKKNAHPLVIVDVSGGVVQAVWNAGPNWAVIDWDLLLGDGADTVTEWEKLPAEAQEFIKTEYPDQIIQINDAIRDYEETRTDYLNEVGQVIKSL